MSISLQFWTLVSSLLFASLVAARASSTRREAAINIASSPGCSSGTDTLSPGLTNCTIFSSVGFNTTNLYTFTPPADSSHNIFFLLSTLQGDATMMVWTPGQTTSDPPAFNSTYSFTTSLTTESYLFIPAGNVTTGTFTLGIRSTTTSPSYSLSVFTPSANIKLVDSEASALQSIHTQCCAVANRSALALASAVTVAGSNICRRSILLNASKTDRPSTHDLCSIPPFLCNEQGNLLRFIAPNGGLSCGGNLDAFGNFTSLQHLDLSSNNLSTTTQQVGQLVSKLQTLRKLYIRQSGLQGNLTCSLVGPQLESLALSGNSINGTLPKCIIQGSALRQLYLSSNAISGPLPDSFDGSKLTVLFMPNQRNRSLTGPLPSTLSNSPLEYLNLGGNALNGTIPDLPSALHMLNLSDNTISGEMKPLPSTLTVLYIAQNNLSGSIPAAYEWPEPLQVMDISSNKLSGSLLSLPPAAVAVDISNNSFTGQLPELPATILAFAADDNQLSGDVADLPLARAMAISLADNNLTGSLSAELLNASRLTLLDLSGNNIGGSLPDRMDLPVLQELHLNGNQLSGSIPGVLASLPLLQALDLSNNNFSGNAFALAGVLQALRVNQFALFNISNNSLSGDLPGQLAWLALFDPTRSDLVGADFRPLSRVFDISGNQFTGEFPTYVIAQFPQLADYCNATGRCNASVAVYGSKMSLKCPTGEALSNIDLKYNLTALESFQLECLTSTGDRVALIPYLKSASSSSMSLMAGTGLTSLSMGVTGIIVGAVIVAAVVAMLGYYVGYKRYKPSASHQYTRVPGSAGSSAQLVHTPEGLPMRHSYSGVDTRMQRQ